MAHSYSPKVAANPFKSAEGYVQMLFKIAKTPAENAELYFGDVTLSVAAFEEDEKTGVWRVELLFAETPEEEDIARRLKVIASEYNVPVPEYSLQAMEMRDWVEALAYDFPPLSAGRFYVHGSHVKDAPPNGSISLQIDAGAAFGSGEHATTRGCLLALDALMRKRKVERILDIGCGSGILAIAAGKAFPDAKVIAADIDPVAAKVTQENIRINRTPNVQALAADGYRAKVIARSAPYDLIFSNILARPLVKLAPDLSAHLAKGGVAILSGLLMTQKQMVLAAHRAQGLMLKRYLKIEDWCILILEK